MNKITDVTREDIFYLIKSGITISHQKEMTDIYERLYYVDEDKHVNVPYHGRMDFVKFFSRIYDLDKLPSTDTRYESASSDIWQHTENNNDWEWDFFIDYPPFQLSNGSDEILLNFLCEMFHPAVRDERTHWKEFLSEINELIRHDGYELISNSEISGRKVYSYRELVPENKHIIEAAKEIEIAFSSDYMNKQIESMLISIHSNPSDAIGKAKELFESCCKTILEKENVKIESKWDLQRLTKETAKVLKLSPHDIADEKKASNTIKQILGNLSGISNGMAELRNSYGSGHGKTSKFKGLTSRHANLAVGSSITAIRFLWETYIEQNS